MSTKEKNFVSRNGVRYRIYIDKKYIVANVITPKRIRCCDLSGLTNKRVISVRVTEGVLQSQSREKWRYLEIEKLRGFQNATFKRFLKVKDNSYDVKVLVSLTAKAIEKRLKQYKFTKASSVGFCFPLVPHELHHREIFKVPPRSEDVEGGLEC